MSRDVEHRVLTHELAQERRAQGRPIWDRKVHLGDVWGNEELTFTERRDAIVRRLRASAWLRGRDLDDSLVEVVDNLAEAEDTEEFDFWWAEMYDHADIDRVWIDIWGGVS